MVTRIRSVDPIQYAYVFGVLEAIVGVVVGIFMWLTFMTASHSNTTGTANFGILAAMGPFLIVLAPIFYGLIGFVFGLILAAVYNLVARWTGGIQMTLQVMEPAPTVTTGTSITTA